MSVMLVSNNPRMRAFLPHVCVDARQDEAREQTASSTFATAAEKTSPRAAAAAPELALFSTAATALEQAPSSSLTAERTSPAPLVLHLLAPGPALPVLLEARDRIHRGWKLLNHPLYGNFRPHQQPYRSLLLEPRAKAAPDPDGVARAAPDPMSLHLLEQALNLYSSVSVLDPAMAPAALRDACAILDCELMRLPLQQAGLAPDLLGALA